MTIQKGIEAEELRLGNYYASGFLQGHDTSKPIIEKIRSFQDMAHAAFTGYPIPLTPELLEKCGCINTDIRGESILKIGGYRYDQIVFSPYMFAPNHSRGQLSVNGYWTGQKVQYLHQLQNLYYALTGKELAVKIP